VAHSRKPGDSLVAWFCAPLYAAMPVMGMVTQQPHRNARSGVPAPIRNPAMALAPREAQFHSAANSAVTKGIHRCSGCSRAPVESRHQAAGNCPPHAAISNKTGCCRRGALQRRHPPATAPAGPSTKCRSPGRHLEKGGAVKPARGQVMPGTQANRSIRPPHEASTCRPTPAPTYMGGDIFRTSARGKPKTAQPAKVLESRTQPRQPGHRQ